MRCFFPIASELCLGFALRRVQVKEEGLKLIGTHQAVVYAEYVNILGRNVHNMKNNTGALVVASKEFRLVVGAD